MPAVGGGAVSLWRTAAMLPRAGLIRKTRLPISPDCSYRFYSNSAKDISAQLRPLMPKPGFMTTLLFAAVGAWGWKITEPGEPKRMISDASIDLLSNWRGTTKPNEQLDFVLEFLNPGMQQLMRTVLVGFVGTMFEGLNTRLCGGENLQYALKEGLNDPASFMPILNLLAMCGEHRAAARAISEAPETMHVVRTTLGILAHQDFPSMSNNPFKVWSPALVDDPDYPLLVMVNGLLEQAVDITTLFQNLVTILANSASLPEPNNPRRPSAKQSMKMYSWMMTKGDTNASNPMPELSLDERSMGCVLECVHNTWREAPAAVLQNGIVSKLAALTADPGTPFSLQEFANRILGQMAQETELFESDMLGEEQQLTQLQAKREKTVWSRMAAAQRSSPQQSSLEAARQRMQSEMARLVEFQSLPSPTVMEQWGRVAAVASGVVAGGLWGLLRSGVRSIRLDLEGLIRKQLIKRSVISAAIGTGVLVALNESISEAKRNYVGDGYMYNQDGVDQKLFQVDAFMVAALGVVNFLCRYCILTTLLNPITKLRPHVDESLSPK